MGNVGQRQSYTCGRSQLSQLPAVQEPPLQFDIKSPSLAAPHGGARRTAEHRGPELAALVFLGHHYASSLPADIGG